MRSTRAVIAGLGTTGSMLAAAACVFLVASAVIAFKGWPGDGFTDRIESLFVNDAAQAPWDRPGTSAVATSAAPAAAAVAATAAGPTFGTPGVVLDSDGSQVSGGRIRLPDGTVVTPPGGSGAGGGGAGPVSGGGQGLPGVGSGEVQGQLGGTVQDTGRSVGQGVRDTTGQVGGAVGGPVGDTVSGTGDSAGNTVDGVTGRVGGLLGGGQ
jgi:hypothetical protein